MSQPSFQGVLTLSGFLRHNIRKPGTPPSVVSVCQQGWEIYFISSIFIHFSAVLCNELYFQVFSTFAAEGIVGMAVRILCTNVFYINMNMMIKKCSIVIFSPVKLAIWEASLDKFVESIQSIPEVIIPVLLVFKD